MILEDNEVALAAAAFDQPPQALKRFVIICTLARSGGHMLCRMLRQLGYGVPLEYFNAIYQEGFALRWGVDPNGPDYPANYLRALIAHRTAGGYCLVKCFPQQFRLVLAAMETIDRPDVSFIHLWRRDSLAQAISFCLAQQSGFWNFTAAPTSEPRAELDLSDLETLRHTRRNLIMRELSWRTYLANCNAPVIHLAYEDLTANRAAALRQLLIALDPEAVLDAIDSVQEPQSPAGLWARQRLHPAERQALYRSYEAKFGPVIPLAEP